MADVHADGVVIHHVDGCPGVGTAPCGRSPGGSASGRSPGGSASGRSPGGSASGRSPGGSASGRSPGGSAGRRRPGGSAAGRRHVLLKIPLDYFGGEVAAVAELDALPDGEGDRLLIVRHFVGLGEPGNQIAFVVRAKQGFVVGHDKHATGLHRGRPANVGAIGQCRDTQGPPGFRGKCRGGRGVPLVSVLPVDWEVEVPEVCVDGAAVVVVDPPPQAASRSVPTTRRLTSRMTESLMERDFIVVLPLE